MAKLEPNRSVFQRVAFIATVAAFGVSPVLGGCGDDDSTPSDSGTNSVDAGSGGSGGSSSGSGGSNGGGGSGGSSSASCSSPGGADTSMSANDHCKGDGGMIAQATGKCTMGGEEDAGDEEADAGPLSGVLGGDYGDTNYGTEAFDDDCKYKVSWKSTPICDNADVTFTMTATTTVDDKPVTGAKPYVEAFKVDGNSVHFPAATKQAPTEKSGGVYDIGPIKFNESGQWIIRFHLFEDCSDSEDSPHGHAAFYVKVP